MGLEDLKNEKPTQKWRERMLEDDGIFSEENISASEEALDNFINSLIGLGDTPSQDEIMDCIEEVVLKYNELNEEYDYFIETMEREELWEFIDKSARIAGLKIDKDMDVTEEWREW
ncbi:hypothetical protein GKZ28_25915 [Clostridium chromiireducens]|uniref:Uncharacterized protein n=1 Tax=Clostridium chromiireducens TaxID=225345 RepID=A0A964RSR0_9CLOT|nr:hypothetical protein [Clostridium chromiireducens]MVX67092.1 hypothetical protein [Clostridium chromiireducens]